MTLHEPHQAGKPKAHAKHLSLHALVLAAGRGRRFGGSKLQARYGDQPLLAYPLAVVAAARERGLIGGGHVVIPKDDKASFELVRHMRLEPVLNSALDRGLSYSLQLGLAALEEAEGAEAALIVLGDQPLVRSDVVEAIISAWSAGGEAIIRPRYEATPDVPGHPVLVARSVWPLIRELQGDAGLGSLVPRPRETLVDVTGHNPDVDTLSDLQALEVVQQ